MTIISLMQDFHHIPSEFVAWLTLIAFMLCGALCTIVIFSIHECYRKYNKE
jgi:ABC-type microcin C transport system permease subunit YejE